MGGIYLKNFILGHKLLTVGIILYITVFIVSKFLSPWQIGDITISDFDSDSSNIVTDKVPVNIIFFGIYELCELLFYASSNSTMDSVHGMMFFISACALFTYMYFIKKLFINEYSDDFLPEKIILDFIYDNIFAYISSLIVYYLYSPVSGLVIKVFEGDTFWLKALISIMLILVLIIPAIPQFLQVLAYVFAISKITLILNYMDKSINWNIILKIIVIFSVAFILISLTNLIINVFLEKAENRIGEFLLIAFPTFFELAIVILKFCLGVIIFMLVLFAIAFIITKFA